MSHGPLLSLSPMLGVGGVGAGRGQQVRNLSGSRQSCKCEGKPFVPDCWVLVFNTLALPDHLFLFL